jgi:cytosine/adenosine deaminase-related metal-dependent hydrolase
MDEILALSEGIGVSSISDWCPSELKKVATHVHKRKKILGIHASEVFREDIHRIIGLKPTFLVHMTKANPYDLNLIANKHIPVVICPSSNAFFGIKTNVKEMMRRGVKLMLGTDNAMITPPNLAHEFDYLIKNFNVDINEAWKMITIIPEETFKL